MTLDNPIFLLLVIVIAGECAGRLRIKSFAFGSSAVVFVALACRPLYEAVVAVLERHRAAVASVYGVVLPPPNPPHPRYVRRCPS